MKLGIVYKNFAAWQGISHIGLGVAGQLNADVLTTQGHNVTVIPATNNIDVVDAIRKPTTPYDLIVVSAPWLKPYDLHTMVSAFPQIRFIVVSHSNVGFLQADPGGIALLRTYANMTVEHPNLWVGANSLKFGRFMEIAWGIEVPILPNMYAFTPPQRVYGPLTKIKLGTFGAIRPQKNSLTAAATALLIQKFTRLPVEFSLSTGREEGGGAVILDAIQQLSRNLPDFHLLERNWAHWSTFKQVVAEQDLLIQLSYTESFNLVTADGISVGVP